MHLGVDFDNTIVCYDELFHKVAREKNLIPAEVPVNKSDVRNYLRRVGKEDAWTEMQGDVYGARMAEASPYPGVLEFFKACRAAGIPVSIISHKTKHPFIGEHHDLHAAALNWLEQQGFFAPARIDLPRASTFFELTKQAKLERIARCGCTHFIDDLPEFLAEAAFPPGALRILFDSNNLYPAESKFLRVRTWPEVRSLFATELESLAAAIALREKVSPFLEQQGMSGGYVLQALPGGANNRVYRLRAEGGDRVLKVYFQNPADPRDRFRAEQAFYGYLRANGVRRTPAPLGWDAPNRFGLFEFIEGRKLRPDEINVEAVNQAVQFVIELNRSRRTAQSGTIPVASEACFSIGEHLDCVDRRLTRLETIEPMPGLAAQAAAFVRDELKPAWERIRAEISTATGQLSSESLPPSERCLSPSDFGFHNALLPADGRLRFFDFEYAGWDDPAKLVCDFFCQPQLAVVAQYWDAFVSPLVVELGFGNRFAGRARLLRPAYQIKWCCIMLNDFVRSEQARREFALGDRAADDRKLRQLDQARRSLRQVQGCQ